VQKRLLQLRHRFIQNCVTRAGETLNPRDFRLPQAVLETEVQNLPLFRSETDWGVESVPRNCS
jgi:hypothetical protein